jgi:hypothetical protein
MFVLYPDILNTTQSWTRAVGMPHTAEASSPVYKEDIFLCCTCLSSFIVCTCELCEIDVKSSNECIFLPHVYRTSSVQWTVCMKANVLIYKWLTLGKTWCVVLFSCCCPESQLHPHWDEDPSLGRIWKIKATAEFLMMWLIVGCS